MKYNLIQIVVLSSFLGLFANNLNSQNKLEWRKYEGIDTISKLHKYAEKKEFPMSGVAEDFGPRPNGGYQFHSGLDLNTSGNGDDDVLCPKPLITKHITFETHRSFSYFYF